MKIQCDTCGRHCGEIRDATLIKELSFVCKPCKDRRLIDDLELRAYRGVDVNASALDKLKQAIQKCRDASRFAWDKC